MRRSLLFICLIIPSCFIYGQVITAHDFIKTLSLSRLKFNSYLLKKGFYPSGQTTRGDTMTGNYRLKIAKTGNRKDSAHRYAQRLFFNNKSAFSYYTTSVEECTKIIRSLKENGFECDNEDVQSPFLYQKNDMTIMLVSKTEYPFVYFNFLAKKEVLPSPKNITYAEDFLAFQSHQMLGYAFGKSNVQRDVYNFSDSEAVRCSILFPNTNRQVIFVWKDQINRSEVSLLLIGSSVRGNKSAKENITVGENIWTLRNGIRANMSLTELVKLNNADIEFNGWNSKTPGTIVPQKRGDIDFNKTGVVLGCLNCRGFALMNNDIVSAHEAIENKRKLFVIALIVMPPNQDSAAFLK